MAIKDRLLKSLKSAYDIMNEAADSHPQKMHPALLELVKAQDLCRNGLPDKSYAKYGEVYDGLIMAIRQIYSGAAGQEKEDIISLCRDLLQYIVTETENEKHFKKEMVFLPYKASMWDSLESVWRAAYEDKDNCLAYVIPIPYCDRNPDGTAKEWHCERDLFPKDVPTLDWQEIDLKTMYPDVIFFHYPYDDCNRVTSVDEVFYSRNLKEYTDKLIYIPYFVLGEPEYECDDSKTPEEVQEKEEQISHFITIPGVLNADCSIVQSEAMKKAYVNILTRYTNAPREYWEEHILGLGSPKFDKVAGSRKEDFELPEEWVRIINGRKTVLYNTGLTAMLKHTDKFIEKIRSVLETFKAQDDVVLWWRPHPLLIPTFESMHPELWADYMEIVKSYQQEGWGVYDDTADLERAIVYTDGYYGDASSVVQLYEKTGKKSLIQNCTDEMIGFSRYNHYTDVAHYGGYVYFSEIYFNGLFRYKDEDNKNVEFLGVFPEEYEWGGDVHRNVFVWEDKLYFFPMAGRNISVYNCKSGNFKTIEITVDKAEDAAYEQCLMYKHQILLVPQNFSKPFILFNFVTEKVEVLLELTLEIASKVPQPSRVETFSLFGGVMRGDVLYLSVSLTNLILKISMNDYKVEVKKLPAEIHLRYMNYRDGNFYFTAQEHVIAIWREETDEFKLYDIPYEPLDDNYPYLQVLPYGDRLYVISGREDRFLKLNLRTVEWNDLSREMPVAFEREFKGALLFLGYDIVKGKIYLYPRSGNGCIIFDMGRDDFLYYNVKNPLNIREKYMTEMIEKENVIYECKNGLIDYVKYVHKVSYDKELKSDMIGKEIYTFLGKINVCIR